MRLLAAAGSVLDYGCGKGKLLGQLARQLGSHRTLVGCDPDTAVAPRWRQLEAESAAAEVPVRLLQNCAEAVAAGPYSVVVCQLVLCALRCPGVQEAQQVLGDLHRAVSGAGLFHLRALPHVQLPLKRYAKQSHYSCAIQA